MRSDDIKYIDYDLVVEAFRYTIAVLPNRDRLTKDFMSLLPAREKLPSLEDLATSYITAKN